MLGRGSPTAGPRSPCAPRPATSTRSWSRAPEGIGGSLPLAQGQRTTMASTSHTTTDHDEIRRWVEEHEGEPAAVRGTGDGDDPGVLRIDFPGGAGEDQLEHIDWD